MSERRVPNHYGFDPCGIAVADPGEVESAKEAEGCLVGYFCVGVFVYLPTPIPPSLPLIP